MARDPDRIRPFLEKIAEFWEKNPDWRFGQLVMNLSRDEESSIRDTWEWEEDDFLLAISNFRDESDMTMKELEERVRAAMPLSLRGIPGAEKIISGMAKIRYKELHPDE